MHNEDRSRAELQQQIEQEVRYANITIIEGIGASQYGIGMVAGRLAEMSEEERQALQRSAETLRKAVARMQERRAAAPDHALFRTAM